jgi:hypothetical protein
MARVRTSRGARRGRGLSSRAAAVMKAFRSAKSAAPRFMSQCGVFPEVSDAASDDLFAIVHELAVKKLGQGRHLRALQNKIRRLASAAAHRGRQDKEAMDSISNELTAVLTAEATAAYLFGLSVGMSVRSLPERLER